MPRNIARVFPTDLRSFLGAAVAQIPPFPFHDLDVELLVDTPITPGQPISFSWSSTAFAIGALDLGTVTFSLYLVDDYGNTDTTSQIYTATLSKPDSAQVASGSFQSNKYAAQPLGDVALRIYKLGTYTLRLVVSGTGADGPFNSGDATLVVQPEAMDETWWKWTVDETRDVQWKVDKYPVHGDFINRSKYASITSCTATMLEQNLTDGDGTENDIGADQPGVAVGVGQEVAISFATFDFSKSWPWFIWAISVPNGAPTDRWYSYRVRMDVLDQFNNGYPAAFSTAVFVHVIVSDTKWAAMSTGAGLMAGAAVALIAAAALACTPAGPIFAGIATGLAAAALVADQIASDPPVPDRGFMELFEPRAVSLPDERDLEGVLSAYRAVLEILAVVEALGVTESRIVGAREGKNTGAERRQVRHFDRLRGELRLLGRRVRKLRPLAAKFLANHQKLTPAVMRKAVVDWQHDLSVRARLQRDFLQAGGSLESFQAIEGLLALPQGVGSVSKTSAVMLSVGTWAERLAVAAAANSAAAKPRTEKKRRHQRE